MCVWERAVSTAVSDVEPESRIFCMTYANSELFQYTMQDAGYKL